MPGTTKPLLSDSQYNVLKFVAQILLPALGTLYFALGDLWNLANVTQVVGTITAVDVFMGLLLGLTTKQYNNSDARYDGTLEVGEAEDGTQLATLKLDKYADPADVVEQDAVSFKVVNKNLS